MKLINRTKWDNKDMRRFLERCIKEVGLESNGRTVVVNYGRTYWYSGLGSYYRKWILVRVPRENINMVNLARLVIHELHHNTGLHHKEMIEVSEIECDWATEYTIRESKPKPKKVRDLKQERYNHVLKLIKKNEKKFKSARTRLKKLYQKKKYYEKIQSPPTLS